jgi:hypothetical protein
MTSATWDGSVIDNGDVYITVTLASQSQSGNTSTISWAFGWNFLGSPTDRELNNGLATIDGVARYNVSGRVRDYPLGSDGIRRYQVASGSYTIAHDSAGNHTVTASGHLEGNTNLSTLSTKSLALPRIPKAPGSPSTPTLSLTAASGASSRAVKLSWSAPSDNGGSSITGYVVERATSPGMTANVVTYSVTGTSTTITEPDYATTYYYRVSAKNAIGTSSYGPAANITTGADVPAAPTIGAVSAIGPLGATVAWSAPSTDNGSAVTSYTVHWSTDSTFAAGVSSATASASPYAITGLTPATTYYAQVQAVNAVGAGAWSSAVSFLTLPSVHVPNAAGTAWVDAIVYMASNGAWTPQQIKTPSADGTTWV